jgi:hypothetical protein
MYTRTCVCVCVYVYIQTHKHIHTHTHTHTLHTYKVDDLMVFNADEYVEALFPGN